MSIARVTLDALAPGQMGRSYLVATYASRDYGRLVVMAYSRIYNEAWEGCVMYEVTAPSARDARAAALRHRKAAERESSR